MTGLTERLPSSQRNLYVGCGLTQAPEAFVEEVEELKGRLGENWHVMEFLGLTAGNEADVYQRDIIENVGGCDAFLGICDYPSLGLGVELREATILKKPTLAVAHAGTRITRLVLGMPAFNPTMRFRRYEDMVGDVPAIVAEEFEVVRGAIMLRASVAPVN